MTSAWSDLSAGYELARGRADSLDRILEWPAQRTAIGDVRGRRILDVGCGSGAKAVSLAEDGAARVVGVDISGAFVEHGRDDVELVQGDLSTLLAVPAVRDATFDTILFLQSIGYSRDQTQTLVDAGSLLASGGRILVQRSHPIRYAVERAGPTAPRSARSTTPPSPTSTARDGTTPSRSRTPPRRSPPSSTASPTRGSAWTPSSSRSCRPRPAASTPTSRPGSTSTWASCSSCSAPGSRSPGVRHSLAGRPDTARGR